MPDICEKPRDFGRPVVCVGEAGKPLIGDVRDPLAVRPGTAAWQDSASVRGGVANLFMALEPLADRHHVRGTARKRSVDFARFLRALSDGHSPNARKLVRVCDNLSTHSPAALYEAFEPAEARRLAERLEWHDTQTRRLAQRGGDGVERVGWTMPGPPHPRPGHARHGGGGLGAEPQRGRRESRLAAHHRQRTRQT